MKSDYSHKIPSLPYKKEEKQKIKYPNNKKQGKDLGCKSDSAKQPEPFDGLEERQREPQRQHYPSLKIHIDFLYQHEAIWNGGKVIVSVTNNGNGTAYSPFVELIESMPIGFLFGSPNPSSFYRRGFLMLSALYPHQTRTVQVSWTRALDIGHIVGLCYDPLLDPRPKTPIEPVYPSSHRKITYHRTKFIPPTNPS